MSFTKLQILTIKQANEIAESLFTEIHALSRKYSFVEPLCMRETQENNLLKSVDLLQRMLEALISEKGGM